MRMIEAGVDERSWEVCPGCGEKINPYKKVWITYPENVMYHLQCAPRGDIIRDSR